MSFSCPKTKLILTGCIMVLLGCSPNHSARGFSAALLGVGRHRSRHGVASNAPSTMRSLSMFSKPEKQQHYSRFLSLTPFNDLRSSSFHTTCRLSMAPRVERPPDFTIDDDDAQDFEPKAKDFKKDEDDDSSEFLANLLADRGDKKEQKKRGSSSRQDSGSSSWMDKNQRFDASENTDDRFANNDMTPRTGRRGVDDNRRGRDGPKHFKERDGPKRFKERDEPKHFKEDFRGTRVFVQNLPMDATWQDLKDHFKLAGEVVFASISVDSQTRLSKGCGVVQFESTDMAKNAIKVMRDHPLSGETLYVREDFQERKDQDFAPERTGGGGGLRGDRMVSAWRCANEENARFLSDEERTSIVNLVKARDAARRRRNYEAGDKMREELKEQHGVYLDDRLKMWWTAADDSAVPVSAAAMDMNLEPWRQLKSNMENDACVNPDLVNGLLTQRDVSRREKDFSTADGLLDEATNSPDGDLILRIHDPSRTWRVWSAEPPRKPIDHQSEPRRNTSNTGVKDPAGLCIDIVTRHDPAKISEVKTLLEKFPGREYNILKKLQQRYIK
mmetsp:Transcript_28106/g.51193  ORF Transcript_28106/g.51193 Transcript_28106/m.51193 type:complete len:557 (-) Transcript_28106:31-1701(-)